MDQTIRSFIAVELESPVRQELVRMQQYLREALHEAEPASSGQRPGPGRGIKWVEPENIHLTLKFLGSIPAPQIPAVQAAMHKTAAAFPAFTIALGRPGAFPDLRRPRIIWVGVDNGTPQLANIAHSLGMNLAGLQIEEEARDADPSAFAAHITIGRIRLPQVQKPLSRALEALPPPSGVEQHVNKLTLFKSQLTSSGPIYSVLAEAPLNPNQGLY